MIPVKRVKRILRGEYVDMAKLLKDNMEAERIQEDGSASLSMRGCSRLEILDALSWTHCFSIYAAIICEK